MSITIRPISPFHSTVLSKWYYKDFIEFWVVDSGPSVYYHKTL
jgi:hypothetical protein